MSSPKHQVKADSPRAKNEWPQPHPPTIPFISPVTSPTSSSPLPSPAATGPLSPSSKAQNVKEREEARTGTASVSTRKTTGSNASETRGPSSSAAAADDDKTTTIEKKDVEEKKDESKASRSGKLNISAFEQNFSAAAAASALSSGPKPVVGSSSALKDRIANLQVAALASPTASPSPDSTPSTKSAPGKLKFSGLAIPAAQTPEAKEKADREKKAVGKLNTIPLMTDLNSMLSSGPKPIKRENEQNNEEKKSDERTEVATPSNSKEKEKEKEREKDREKERERQKKNEENLNLPATIGETSTAEDEPDLQHVQMARPKVARKHRSAAGRGGKKPPATKPKFKEIEFEDIAAVKVKIIDENPDSADSKKRSKRNKEDGDEKDKGNGDGEKDEEEERERARAKKKAEEDLIEEERKRQEEILRQVAEEEKRREEELLKKLNDEEKKIRDDALAYFEEQYKTLGFDERKATSYMILLAQGALINKYDVKKGKKEQKKMFATANGQLFFADPKKGKPDPKDSIQLYRVREVQRGRVGVPFQKAAKKASDANCLVIVGAEADAFIELPDEEVRNLWMEALLYVKHVGPEAGR